MLIGDRERFAIEYDIEPVHDDTDSARRADRIRWWCGGEPVGHYEPATTIGESVAAARRILAQDNGRRSTELMSRPAREVARIVTDALFADSDRSDAEIAADGARYWPFFVRPRSGGFDAWDIFVVEGERHARLVWCRVDQREVGECALNPGEFSDVLRKFVHALTGTGR